jgi:hypothetical protein
MSTGFAHPTGVDERVLGGRDEPARASVGDDRHRAVRAGSDRRQAAGHRLDKHEPKRLRHGRQHEHVGRVQRLRKLFVRTPAGQKDLAICSACPTQSGKGAAAALDLKSGATRVGSPAL